MKKYLLIIMMSVLILSTITITPTEAKDIVRVGVFDIGNFQSIDQEGKVSGYNIDYLKRISEYSHISYQFVEVKNWNDGLNKLDSGDIDIIAPAQKTKEREKKYIYSSYAMSVEYGAILTLKDTNYIYEDFSTMKSLHYGAVKNSPITTNFTDSYCKNHNFTPHITYYNDMTDLFKALNKKEVDAIATNIMLQNDQTKMIGRYSPSPVYFIMKKDKTSLMTKIDEAMTEIRINQPTYEAELMSKYFSSFSNTSYTRAELDYIKDVSTITIGYHSDSAPISYKNAQGEFDGVTRDILDIISEKSGLTFKYKELPSKQISKEYLRENGIFVLSDIEYTNLDEDADTTKLSSPYFSNDKVLVTIDDLDVDVDTQLKVALPTNSNSLEKIIKSLYPYFDTTLYESSREAFDSVVSKNNDAVIVNRYVAESMISLPAYSHLHITPIQTLNDELCFSILTLNTFSKEEIDVNNSYFLSIIDKTLNQISSEDLNAIVIKNTNECHYTLSFLDFIYEYRLIVISLVVLIIMVMVLLMRSQKLENNKNKELEVKNNQLADAVHQAEKANLAKSQFLSRMSHEIRTPMNAIVGITEIAKHHEDDPHKVDDYLGKIESSSRVLLNIINDVLDMSAIESDKLKIASRDFDMKRVLNEISTVYYPQCENKGIDFIMNVDIEQEIVSGDSLRVHQILLNLISNAFKFTDSGSITVNVSQTSLKDQQVFMRFEVKDTGCGMSNEMQTRLFRPFEQEDATTAQKHGGSGLGLSIAKNLVDMMHGAIKVESIEGKGTTFIVDIPFGIGERQKPMTAEKLHTIKALLVDDDESAREYAASLFTRIGVQYDVCSSGKEAIEKAKILHDQGRGYDLCLIDWKMPEMSGVELTRKLREYFDSDTLIIILSAYDLSEVEDEAKEAGADYFVTKPIFQSTVFDILMNLSGGQYHQDTASEGEFDFTGHRLLLAEDNMLNEEIATELLEMVNMEVVVAHNGQEAYDTLVNSKPGTFDLILMDIQMPILNGYEATQKIRESTHPDGKNIPILAMTANAFSEDVSSAYNAGMNGHIAKPIDTEVMYSTIKKCLK